MTTHRNILLTLLVSLTLSSCNLLGPVDDIQPDFVLTDDDVITDSNSAEYLLNGIYSRYRERSLTSMRNGMFILTGTLNNTTVAEGATNFRENNLRPQNNTVLNYYTGLYAIINQSNSLIANLRDTHPKGLTEARKAEILGEAYFHKAFAEFMLLRSFGEFWDRSSDYGVVLYNEPVRGNDEAKRRAPVEECYTQILSDLDEAAAAPAYDGRAYRVNGVTVQMLRARVLLYMGRFADAATTARTAIADATAGGASLETDYLTVFAQGFSSPETLFAPYVSYPLETMVRLYLLQNLYDLSDEATVAEAIDSRAFSDFCGIDSSNQVPDGDTLGRFRNLLIKNGLQEKLFAQVVAALMERGLILKKGTIVNSTIISVPSSTKNKEKKRDPDAHQVKKGNTWHFGYKAHIGVDRDSGLVHTVEATAANVHDATETSKLLTGDEDEVYGDSGYLGAEKRGDAIIRNKAGRKIKYRINRRPSQVKKLSKSGQYAAKKAEHAKSSVRAKVEHAFGVVKKQLRFRKTRYRGLEKQRAKFNIMFALANLILADRPCLAA